MPSFVEIVVEGYGNGIDGVEDPARQHASEYIFELPDNEIKCPLQEFDFGLASASDEPTLEQSQLHDQAEDFQIAIASSEHWEPSPCDSYISTASGDFTDSNRSSTYLTDYDSPDTDASSWDGDCHKRDSDISTGSALFDTQYDFAQEQQDTSGQESFEQGSRFLGTKTNHVSVNAGCYTPTGKMDMPVSKFAQRRALSTESVKSEASSVYPEESQQAAEIEEEETRGRRRSRALDRLSRIGFVKSQPVTF